MLPNATKEYSIYHLLWKQTTLIYRKTCKTLVKYSIILGLIFL